MHAGFFSAKPGIMNFGNERKSRTVMKGDEETRLAWACILFVPFPPAPSKLEYPFIFNVVRPMTGDGVTLQMINRALANRSPLNTARLTLHNIGPLIRIEDMLKTQFRQEIHQP